jgi:hypothetical protein
LPRRNCPAAVLLEGGDLDCVVPGRAGVEAQALVAAGGSIPEGNLPATGVENFDHDVGHAMVGGAADEVLGREGQREAVRLPRADDALGLGGCWFDGVAGL